MQIDIDGSPLRVTRSLHGALTHIRGTRKSIYLWTDAICINQTDEIEKNQQVQQMGRIYALASHTIIFLGPCDERSEQILSRIFNFSGKETCYDDAGQEGIVEILKLLERPWFYRVWTFQELVLSHDPKLQFGNIRCAWQNFSAFINRNLGELSSTYQTIARPYSSFKSLDVLTSMHSARIDAQVLLFQNLYPQLKNLHPTDAEKEGMLKLANILSARRGFGVSDPRDRIFAHLGLVQGHPIRPRYDTTTEEIYEEFACTYIKTLHDLSVLQFIDIPPDGYAGRIPGLASWIPDWNVRIRPPTSLVKEHDTFESTPPSSEHEARRQLSFYRYRHPMHSWETIVISPFFSGHILWAAGFQVSTITEISPVELDFLPGMPQALFSSNTDSHHKLKGARQRQGERYDWWRSKLPPDQQILPPLTPAKNFTRKRFGRRDNNTKAYHLQYPEDIEDRATFYEDGIECRHGSVLDMLIGGDKIEQNLLSGRRLARAGKILAWVPITSRTGDMICFLEGSNVPFLLRRNDADIDANTRPKSIPEEWKLEEGVPVSTWAKEGEASHITLVGECYLGDLKVYYRRRYLKNECYSVFAIH